MLSELQHVFNSHFGGSNPEEVMKNPYCVVEGREQRIVFKNLAALEGRDTLKYRDWISEVEVSIGSEGDIELHAKTDESDDYRSSGCLFRGLDVWKGEDHVIIAFNGGVFRIFVTEEVLNAIPVDTKKGEATTIRNSSYIFAVAAKVKQFFDGILSDSYKLESDVTRDGCMYIEIIDTSKSGALAVRGYVRVNNRGNITAAYLDERLTKDYRSLRAEASDSEIRLIRTRRSLLGVRKPVAELVITRAGRGMLQAEVIEHD